MMNLCSKIYLQQGGPLTMGSSKIIIVTSFTGKEDTIVLKRCAQVFPSFLRHSNLIERIRTICQVIFSPLRDLCQHWIGNGITKHALQDRLCMTGHFNLVGIRVSSKSIFPYTRNAIKTGLPPLSE